MTEEEEQVELVEVTVKIPKAVLEFYKAFHIFAKCQEPLDELMGYQITSELQADFGNCLTSLVDINEVAEGYGLDKVSKYFKQDC